MKLFKRKVCVDAIMALGISLVAGYSYADVNVPCGDNAVINGVTLFGGSNPVVLNTCGNNVTITTTNSKVPLGGNETNNTNGIYYAMNQGKTVFAQLRSLLPKYEFKITPRCNFHSTG